jgi:hypothetical protein
MHFKDVALALAEQFADVPRSDLQKQERMLERFGDVAFTGLGVVVAIGIGAMLYAIVTKMILSGTQPLSGLLLAAFVIFAGLSLAYVFWNETLKESRKRVDLAPGRDLNAAATARLIDERPFNPAPSVVEDTTALLSIERKTKELE